MSGMTEAPSQFWPSMKTSLRSAHDEYVAAFNSYMEASNLPSDVLQVPVEHVFNMIDAPSNISIFREAQFQSYSASILDIQPRTVRSAQAAPSFMQTSSQEEEKLLYRSFVTLSNMLGDVSAFFQESVLPEMSYLPDPGDVSTINSMRETFEGIAMFVARMRAGVHYKQSLRNAIIAAKLSSETETSPSLLNLKNELERTLLLVSGMYGEGAPVPAGQEAPMLHVSPSTTIVNRDDFQSLTDRVHSLKTAWQSIHLSQEMSQDVDLLQTSLHRVIYWHERMEEHLERAGVLVDN